MDVVTATVFSYTCTRFRFLLDKKGKRDQYLAFNSQASFPVPINYRCYSKEGNDVALRTLIEGFMGPRYAYDAYTNFYRTLEDAQRSYDDFAQETQDLIYEEIQEEEDRQDELRAK